jgi:hypothetical protein
LGCRDKAFRLVWAQGLSTNSTGFPGGAPVPGPGPFSPRRQPLCPGRAEPRRTTTGPFVFRAACRSPSLASRTPAILQARVLAPAAAALHFHLLTIFFEQRRRATAATKACQDLRVVTPSSPLAAVEPGRPPSRPSTRSKPASSSAAPSPARLLHWCALRLPGAGWGDFWPGFSCGLLGLSWASWRRRSIGAARSGGLSARAAGPLGPMQRTRPPKRTTPCSGAHAAARRGAGHGGSRPLLSGGGCR